MTVFPSGEAMLYFFAADAGKKQQTAHNDSAVCMIRVIRMV